MVYVLYFIFDNLFIITEINKIIIKISIIFNFCNYLLINNKFFIYNFNIYSLLLNSNSRPRPSNQT